MGSSAVQPHWEPLFAWGVPSPAEGLTADDAHTIHRRPLPPEPVPALYVSFTARPIDRLTRFGVSCKLSTDVHVSGPRPGRSGEPQRSQSPADRASTSHRRRLAPCTFIWSTYLSWTGKVGAVPSMTARPKGRRPRNGHLELHFGAPSPWNWQRFSLAIDLCPKSVSPGAGDHSYHDTLSDVTFVSSRAEPPASRLFASGRVSR